MFVSSGSDPAGPPSSLRRATADEADEGLCVSLLSSWPLGPSVSGLMAAAKMQSGADEWDRDRFGLPSRILPVCPEVGVVCVQ